MKLNPMTSGLIGAFLGVLTGAVVANAGQIVTTEIIRLREVNTLGVELLDTSNGSVGRLVIDCQEGVMYTDPDLPPQKFDRQSRAHAYCAAMEML